jgi:hypothetical protein
MKLIALVCVLAASPAFAQSVVDGGLEAAYGRLDSVPASPPLLSLDRISFGFTAWGVVYDVAGDNDGSGFETGSHLSYNVSERLLLFTAADRNWEREWTETRFGGSVKLYGDRPADRFAVTLGANLTYYDERPVEDRWSWQAVAEVNAGVDLARWFTAVGGRRHDPENDVGSNRLGLRVEPVIGLK